MRVLIAPIFILSYLTVVCQTPSKLNLQTNKFAGKYTFGSSADKEAIGLVFVYPETDSTILFYFEANHGPPSLNSGALYGRLKLSGDSGTYFRKLDGDEKGCRFKFKFHGDILSLIEDDNTADCGFGHGVYPHGMFKRLSKKIPTSFINRSGEEVFFSKTRPEDYLE